MTENKKKQRRENRKRKTLVVRVGDAKGGNYESKLYALPDQPPGLYHVHVLHDDWCAMLAGTGPCNCEPEITAPQRHGEPAN